MKHIEPRKPETDNGIQEPLEVAVFDTFHRTMKKRGWIQTNAILGTGITTGHVLEVGCGPGYLGQDWLAKTQGTTLTAIDISKAMLEHAILNARENKVSERAAYTIGNAMRMPFASNSFDAVFSNGSLHEWEDPVAVCNEIGRVLKPGGKFYISDLRRDLPGWANLFLFLTIHPRSMAPGLKTSLAAAYTPFEANSMISSTSLSGANIKLSPIGIQITGRVD